MTPFFNHLIARVTPSPANVLPRQRSRFEPDGGTVDLTQQINSPGEQESHVKGSTIRHNRYPAARHSVAEERLTPEEPVSPRHGDPSTALDPAAGHPFSPSPVMPFSPAAMTEHKPLNSGNNPAGKGGQDEHLIFTPERQERGPGEKIFPREKNSPGDDSFAATALPAQYAVLHEDAGGREKKEEDLMNSYPAAVMGSGLLPDELAWLQDIKKSLAAERPQPQDYAAALPPVIRVTIGRIEVKAANPVAPAVREHAIQQKPRLSLNEFLRPKKNTAS